MEVKELAKKIEEMNVQSCGYCPFRKGMRYENDCKLHSSMCIYKGRNTAIADDILILEKYFEDIEEVEEFEEL